MKGKGAIYMTANIKKVLAGGMVAVGVAVPTTLFMNQRDINQEINEQRKSEQEMYKLQIQEHEQEANDLLNQIEELGLKIEGLNKTNKELESKNSELEGVRSTVLNSLGYEPSAYEIELLQRLVECEAGAESMEGKIAVANVVMNRIKSDKFPNSIEGVIYQENQFEPIVSGVIYEKTPSEDSKEAVRRALMGEKAVPEDIVNFWASWLDSSHELWNHLTPVMTIGVHHFARGWN